MKRFLGILILGLIGGLACGQVIDIVPRDFTAIELKGNVKCIVSTSDSSASTITLYGISAKQVKWEVRKGVLYVDVPSGVLDQKGYALVRVNQPALSKILVGGAEVASNGIFKGSTLSIETLGSINRVLLNVEVNHLDILCTGDSDIAIKGSANSSTLNASLGSRIDCLGCRADSVMAECFGTSEIYVQAHKYLQGKATFGGSIYFAGDAAIAPKSSMWGGITPIEYRDGMQSFTIFATDTTIIEPVPVVAVPEKPKVEKVEKVKKAAKVEKAEKVKKAEKPIQQSEPATKPDEDYFF